MSVQFSKQMTVIQLSDMFDLERSFATSSPLKKGSSFKTCDKFAVNVCNSPLVTSSSKVQLSSSSRKSPRKHDASSTSVSKVLRFSSVLIFHDHFISPSSLSLLQSVLIMIQMSRIL